MCFNKYSSKSTIYLNKRILSSINIFLHLFEFIRNSLRFHKIPEMTEKVRWFGKWEIWMGSFLRNTRSVLFFYGLRIQIKTFHRSRNGVYECKCRINNIAKVVKWQVLTKLNPRKREIFREEPHKKVKNIKYYNLLPPPRSHRWLSQSPELETQTSCNIWAGSAVSIF